jgi:SOS-response transcriptional repressor LexA
LAGGTKTFAELKKALLVSGPKPQLGLVEVDNLIVEQQRFETLLPLYSLKAAAGYFGNGENVEGEGWVDASEIGRLDELMFVARAVGRSMEPRIYDGDYCVFLAKPRGTRQGKIVLAQYRGPGDPETGGSFTVKRYISEKSSDVDGDWRHTRVTLLPENSEFDPIVLTPEAEDDVQIIAEVVAVLGRS